MQIPEIAMKTNPRIIRPDKLVLKRRYRILVVDDDLDSRELVAFAMVEAGYAAEVAQDGFDAIAKLQAVTPDLVLTDLMMPGMHGVDLAQWIRTYKPGLPVIVITGRETYGLRTDAEAYGAIACLVKPVNLEELLWTIERALAQTGSERAALPPS
ncbi:MAG TPA: response regulator [Polyangia bacterium]|nr:response regulator [Polyangia bacterium]